MAKQTSTKEQQSSEQQSSPAPKRMVLYARVSSDEQTRGNYPSCESQVEELETACRVRGWQPVRTIRDEGYSAGSLKRPGLTEIRWLVESREVDGVLCTWYDRLTRSRDFYVLDKEFQAHGVEFITLHDPTDTTTASGRFMESMLVAAKTYEREQTSEKVREKMRMRADKGMWNGGKIPFDFRRDPETKAVFPDTEQSKIVGQMFRIYIDTRSEFAVRDWLRQHQVPTRSGSMVWQPSAIRRILTNRRYIAEIEVNGDNKGIEGLPATEAYRIAKAPYEPLVPIELFEQAQALRQEKRQSSPNRRGRPRSYSQTQCQRVYPLQGILECGHCGHAMAPWYVHHKAGQKNGKKIRKTDSYINYYLCAKQQKDWKHSDHKNLVSAKLPETWILDKIKDLVTSESNLEEAMHYALDNSRADLAPAQEALTLTTEAIRRNQDQTEELITAISGGNAKGALWEILNEKAAQLRIEQARLLTEQRHLTEAVAPLNEDYDAATLRSILSNFAELAEEAEPEELQRLLRLTVRRIEWMPDGEHWVQYYHAPKTHLATALSGGQGFHTNMRNGSP